MLKPLVVLRYAIVVFFLATSMSAEQPVQRIDDNSDWWSVFKDDSMGAGLKPQNRGPSSSNYSFQGGWLRDEPCLVAHCVPDIVNRFGPATAVERRDEATGREQVCYESPDGKFHFVVEWGEINAVAYLFDGGPDWNGSKHCTVSPLALHDLSAGSGLKLGLSRKQIRSILGSPNVSNPYRMVYYFHFKKRTSVETLKALRASNPGMSEDEFKRNFETADATSYIEARFSAGKLTYLAVSESDGVF